MAMCVQNGGSPYIGFMALLSKNIQQNRLTLHSNFQAGIYSDVTGQLLQCNLTVLSASLTKA